MAQRRYSHGLQIADPVRDGQGPETPAIPAGARLFYDSVMTENKTQPTGASVSEFLNSVPEAQRQTDAWVVCDLMAEVTGQTPRMWGPSMVGFGYHHHKYASGREVDWFVVGFSPRKAALSLYLTSGRPLDSDLLDQLGKHRMGKGCLYVNKLADIDMVVLRRLIESAATPPD